MTPFEPGELIGGRYELGRQLGAGGMARVYLGHDRLLDREVAVKVLSEPYASDPQFVERFRREASAAAGLNHPNIVAVYDRGEADGSYYIVMEYLSGPDLKQVIRRRAPLPPVQAIDFAQQILAALGAAHRRDVVHRDVKPQNVLVAEDGHLKVTDFGIARAGAQTDMTEAGSVIGTAQYLSPEQARGDEVTAASDCYAVGIVLYEMLTGRVPFDGDRPVAVAMKQISDEPVPPREVEPSVPPELDAVVLRALAKRPSERYRTADELSRALAEARTAIDGSGSTTQVMPAAGPATAETRVMDPVTGPTRVGPPPPDEPPAGPPQALALDRRRHRAAGGDRRRRVRCCWATTREAVTIPAVAGQTEAEARATLEGAGLGVEVQNVTSEEEAGLAVGTDPPEGNEVDEGDTVTLRVSDGPGPDASVPDVVGDNEADATAALRREEFDVDVQQEASADVDEGIVIRQSPAGGEPGRGRQHRDDRGLERARERRRCRTCSSATSTSAEGEINGAGLVVGNVTREPSEDFRRGHGHPPEPRARRARSPEGYARRPGPRGGARHRRGAGDRRQHRHRRRDQARERRLRRRPAQEVSSDEPAGNVVGVGPGGGHRGRARQHDHHLRQPRPVGRRPRQPRRGRRRRRRRLGRRRGAAAPADPVTTA